VITAIYVLGSHASEVPGYLAMIVKDAFGGSAVAGGALGTVIVTGVRRGVFSNEAGIGTESMAHGAAKTDEPVREGLVAMMGPIIDTLVICTATALIILISGAWKTGEGNGVTLTAQAFEATMPGVGIYILIIAVICFSTSTIFGYSYYGSKCLGYLIGADKQHFYNYIIVVSTVIAAILSLDAMVGVVDGTFALMAIPTTTSALALSPKVMSAARKYFAELKHMEIAKPPRTLPPQFLRQHTSPVLRN